MNGDGGKAKWGRVTYADFVLLRNTFRDADDETNLVFNRLDDSVRGGGWGDVEDGRVGLHFPDGLRPGEYRVLSPQG